MPFDIIVGQSGDQTTLTALASSPVACQLIIDMEWGTNVTGTRYLSEADAYAAFDLIDKLNLTTRTFA